MLRRGSVGSLSTREVLARAKAVTLKLGRRDGSVRGDHQLYLVVVVCHAHSRSLSGAGR